VFAYLKQNAPARGRTLLLICVVIEAMITFIAVQDNTRIGLFGQSLFPDIGGCFHCSTRKPGRAAILLSIDPPEGVHDNIIRVLYNLRSDSKICGSGFALFRGVKYFPPELILGTGEFLRNRNVPFNRVGE
jgi:hypothetical protein